MTSPAAALPAYTRREQRQSALRRQRRSEAMEIVQCHAVFSAAANFIPVPVLDSLVVAGVQLQMMQELARYYRKPFDPVSARSLIASAGIGVVHYGIGRSTLVQQLAASVGAVPVIGGMLRWGTWPGVLGAYTFLLGRSCVDHFEDGRDFRDFSRSLWARLPLNPMVGVT